MKAIDRYDLERGHPFQSFAVPTILGEMRRYFRDSGWAIHVPRGAQERALKVRDARERMANEHGHAPTVNQLAEYLEIDVEDVLDALQAIQAYETVSLDAPGRAPTRARPPTATRSAPTMSVTSSWSSTRRWRRCSDTSPRANV